MNLNTYFLRVGHYNPNNRYVASVVVPVDSRLTNVMGTISNPENTTYNLMGSNEEVMIQHRVPGSTMTGEVAYNFSSPHGATAIGTAELVFGPHGTGELPGKIQSLDLNHNFAAGDILSVEGNGTSTTSYLWIDYVFTMVV